MKEYRIDINDAEQRVDRFLKKILPNATLGLIYKMLRTGKIKINKKKKKYDYLLEQDDVVRVFLSDEDIQKLQKAIEKKKTTTSNTLSKKDIIYEDKELIAINKQPGVLVHSGDFKTNAPSLIQMVQDYLADQKLESLTFKPQLAHRIDKDTSGIVLVGKTKQTLMTLVRNFKERNIKKTYLALCKGVPTKKRATITAKLHRIEWAKNENKVQIDEKQGKSAISHYQVVKEFGDMCLVKIDIDTGRMHQIRVHMASIGHPLLGDTTYGDKKYNSICRGEYNIKRHMLHAWTLKYMHPKKQVERRIFARIPTDMSWVIEKKWGDVGDILRSITI